MAKFVCSTCYSVVELNTYDVVDDLCPKCSQGLIRIIKGGLMQMSVEQCYENGYSVLYAMAITGKSRLTVIEIYTRLDEEKGDCDEES
jgi:hypothetical protein